MTKKVLLLLFFIFVLAYILRVLYLPQLALTFGYDQARDAYNAQQILSGDLKILGPPASTPGLYHGVFYFYTLVPGYFLGNGSPLIAAYWIAILNALTVFIVFYLTWFLTRKTGAALLAAFLFAISWESTQYAVWMSNPTLGVWTVPLIYLGLWAWLKERKTWGSIVCAVGLGLSVQAEIFLLYHATPVGLWVWVMRKNVARSDLLKFVIVLLAVLSSMIFAELKFGFRGLSGVAQLFVAQDAIVLSRGLGDFLLLYLNQLGRVFAYNIYPGNVGYGGVFVLALVVLAISSWDTSTLRPAQGSEQAKMSWKPFLALWLLSHITVVSVGGTSTPFLLVGIGTAVSIFVAIWIYNWWASGTKWLAIFVLAVVIFSNITMIMKENPKGQTIFAIQKDMILKKQLAAIDYTYKEANGRPFSVDSLTSPLWINIVWTYLYKWYGLPKYGYVPEWHGRDQIGQLDTLPQTKGDTTQYFLILEPMAGIPARYLPETISEEDAQSNFAEEKSFGEIVVQKRVRKVQRE